MIKELMKDENSKFSNYSFITSIVLLILYAYAAFTFYEISISSGEYNPPTLHFYPIIALTCLIGLIFAVLSHVKSEPNTWKKYCGMFFNVVFSVIFAGLIMFLF